MEIAVPNIQLPKLSSYILPGNIDRSREFWCQRVDWLLVPPAFEHRAYTFSQISSHLCRQLNMTKRVNFAVRLVITYRFGAYAKQLQSRTEPLIRRGPHISYSSST